MQLSQITKIVSCLAPVDSNGGAKTHCYVSLKDYNHITFIVQVGNLAGDITLTVKESSDNAGTGATAIAFNYRKASTGAAAKSVLDGTLTAALAAGITLGNAADDNKVWVIELDADELSSGKPYVNVVTTDPAAAGLISSVAILSQPRYAKDVPPDPTV